MKSKILTLIILVSIVGFVLAACSPANKFAGTWVDMFNSKYTFSTNGTLVIEDGFGLTSTTGTFDVLDSNQVKITMDGWLGLTGGAVFDYQFSGDQLTLTTAGISLVLTREN